MGIGRLVEWIKFSPRYLLPTFFPLPGVLADLAQVCPVRIYEESRRVPVVICSQLSYNQNTSIANGGEYLAAEVVREHLPDLRNADPLLM